VFGFWSLSDRAVADQNFNIQRMLAVNQEAPVRGRAEYILVFDVRITMVEVVDKSHEGVVDNSHEANDVGTDHSPQYRISDSSLARIVFGRHSDTADLRLRLPLIASNKIEEASRTCELTESQRQKLQLAAKGDIERFIDKLLDLEQEFRTQAVTANAVDISNLATALSRRADPLRGSLISGPFDQNSLYAKTLKNIRNANPGADCPD
jgi:hypothetical protein